MMFDRRLLSNFDWVLTGLVVLICSVGLVAMHSATLSSEAMSYYMNRQVYWMLIGGSIALCITLVDYHTIVRFAYFFHGVVIFSLILVLLFGTGGPGSPVQRWLAVGPVFIQPSEFAKLSTVFCLSYYFRENQRGGELFLMDLFWPVIIVGVPFVMILKQPDLGTALLVVMVAVPIIFVAGIHIRSLLFIAGGAITLLPVAWFYILKPYQKDRILTFMDPERDPLGKGYHVIQSKIAIGSGQLFGKGFEEGTQGTLNFLPAHHTDFIFSIFSEEWGFLGAAFVIVLFLALLLWACFNVFMSKDRIGVFLTVGIVSIMAAHVLINIGMVTGVMPVVGVPLPFFSYGGSSMLSMMIGVGMLLNIRMRRFLYNT